MANYRAALNAFKHRLKHVAERWLIIHPLELTTRIFLHCDPRVYLRSLRLRRVSHSEVPRSGDRFLLFVLYERQTIPSFIQSAFYAARQRGLNLVISTNAKITEELRQKLLAQCYLLIERRDLGRDFGCYQDALNILLEGERSIERVILLNDSLFYLDKGVEEVIAGLDGEDDLIAVTEDLREYYHLQSFALSFSRQVLAHRRFRKYWRRYRPISTRRWAIQRGERDLTKCLLQCGFKPFVLYHAAQLIPHLRTLDLRQLLKTIQLLPRGPRERLNANFHTIQEAQTSATLSKVETLSKAADRLARSKQALASSERQSNINQMLMIASQTALIHKEQNLWQRENFIREIVESVARFNQAHNGGFLFMKFLGMPIFKRDIFYREVFDLPEIEDILTELKTPMKDSIIADLRRKGTARTLKGLQRILYRHGSI
jgi:hypothetical protein